MEPEYFSIVCEDGGERLDKFLSAETGLTRSRVQTLINGGLVTVSGKPAKPSLVLAAGDVVEGEIPPPEPVDVKPVNIPLHVIYEDNDVIVINKPKNMVVHPAPGHTDDTLVNALMYRLGGELSGINGVMRPGIVHRLDKDTTGLIIAAKTNEAHLSLAEQLKNREMGRVYNAVVFGDVKDDTGIIDAPVGRHPKNRLKMSVNYKNGRSAVTRYRVIERFGKYTHVEASLETGRTHQIRVHMTHIGFPVLGDTLYTARNQPFGLCSQVLNASILTFTHPRTNERVSLESGLPDYFRVLLEKIRGM